MTTKHRATNRQTTFAHLVASGTPPEHAVIAAGYKSKNPDQTASRLMANPIVLAEIDAARDRRASTWEGIKEAAIQRLQQQQTERPHDHQ